MLVTYGEVTQETEKDPTRIKSSIEEFFSPMDKIPYYGAVYNMLVAILVILIAMLSLVIPMFKFSRDIIKKFSKVLLIIFKSTFSRVILQLMKENL